MRVAILSPFFLVNGLWEGTFSHLAEKMAKKGVEVTLFTTSAKKAKRSFKTLCPGTILNNSKISEPLYITRLFEIGDEFDIIHNNAGFLPLTYTGMTNTPVVTTIYHLSSKEEFQVYKRYNKKVLYVSINNAERLPGLNYISTVYPCIDPKCLDFYPKKGDYLFYHPTILRRDDLMDILAIHEKARTKIIISGDIEDHEFFKKEIGPYIKEKSIIYLEDMDTKKENKILGEAFALLYFEDSTDPFRVNILKSMACGTPVIALNKGSISEFIRDGENGFLIDSIDDAAKVMKGINSIERESCRRWVENAFSFERMAENYIKVYKDILFNEKREDHRPWGYYEVISDRTDHKVKRIVLFPEKRLSLQKHIHRGEHWYILSGEAIVTKDNERILLSKGNSVNIPKGATHRIQNPGTENLVFIEVQTGDYFGEDDIIRLDDDFGRV